MLTTQRIHRDKLLVLKADVGGVESSVVASAIAERRRERFTARFTKAAARVLRGPRSFCTAARHCKFLTNKVYTVPRRFILTARHFSNRHAGHQLRRALSMRHELSPAVHVHLHCVRMRTYKCKRSGCCDEWCV